MVVMFCLALAKSQMISPITELIFGGLLVHLLLQVQEEHFWPDDLHEQDL